MAETNQQMYSRHSKLLWDYRRFYDYLFQEVADNIMPELEDMQQTQQPGQERGRMIFNGTARQALEIHVNGLYGWIVNQSIPWFRYTIDNLTVGDRHDVKIWLQDAEKAMYAELNNSNFYREIYNFIYIGAGIGTVTMLIEDNFLDGRVHFETVHPGQAAISQGYWGKVDAVSRKYKVQLRHMVKKLGGRDKLKDVQLQKMYDHNPYEMVEFVHLTVPRDTFDPSKVDNTNMPWASIWLRDDKVINESGYKQFPWAAWRYNLIGAEMYGNCPSLKVLPDIKTLNKMTKALIKYAQLQSNPPMNVHVSQRGRENFIPGGYNHFKHPDHVARPINVGGQFGVGENREDRMRDDINRAFSVDFFLMLENAQRQMTATEVIEREGERAAILGPMSGRFTWEALETVLDRVFDIALERGRIPTPPDILLERGQRIKVDFIGPLAQAQKRQLRGSTLTRGWEMMRPAIELVPSAADNIDTDEWIRETADSSGMPQRLIRPFADVLELRNQRAEAQAEAANSEMLKANASALKDVADADKSAGGMINEAGQILSEQQRGA